MKSFLLLLKIQLMGLFGINKRLHADAAKTRRKLSAAVLVAVVVVAAIEAYVANVVTLLIMFGLVDVIPLLAVIVGAFASVVTTFVKANGALFKFKDYDFLMSLPVSRSSVVLSRIIFLYLASAAVGLLVMAPAFVLYAGQVPVTGLGAVCMVLSVLLAPVLPLAPAIVLAALVAAASARFKHANVAVGLFMIAGIVAMSAAPFFVLSQIADFSVLDDVSGQIIAQLGALYPPAAWAAAGVVQGDLAQFALFFAVSALAAVLLVALLVRLFVSVNSAVMSVRPRGSFSFEDGKASGASARAASLRSPFAAVVFKEARLLQSIPTYLLNATSGYALVLVAAVAAAVARASGALSPDELPPQLVPYVGMALPWIIAFLVGAASTTTASISLEGSSRWIMLAAPVPARTVLAAKAALNLAIALPAVVVSGILLSWAFALEPLGVLLVFVVPASFALFATFVGLLLNLRRPRYDWASVYEPVKRSFPVVVLAVGDMVLVAACMVAQGFLGPAAGLVAALLIASGSLAAWRASRGRMLPE